MEAIGEELNDGGGDGGAQEVNDGEVAAGEGEDFEGVDGPIDRGDIVSQAAALSIHLRSSGYDEDVVSVIVHAQIGLLYGMLDLDHRKEGPVEDGVTVTIGGYRNSDAVILPDGLNLVRHWWEQFVRKLASVPANGRGYIDLALQQIRLGSELVHSLLPVLEGGVPIQGLMLVKNHLGSDNEGVKFAFDAIRAISTLTALIVDSNPLQPEDMLALMKVVIDHPRLDALALKRCGMDRESELISTAITCALENVREIVLEGNQLGSHSAKLISACLAKNPIAEFLNLTDNRLGDDEAVMLAWSLRTNTNLRKLRLGGNQITQKGFSALKRAIFNQRSMDRISQHSNHTCFIDSGEDTFSLVNNLFIDPDKNRRLKLGRCLPVGSDVLHVMVNIRDIPIGIVPQILVFVQGLESIFTVKCLDATFRLMKNWNMPLLYTSSAGPCPRRSNRIRAKKVSKLMGE